MRHEINIKNFNITRRGKRHYMVGCFKLCPRVLTSSKRETNRNRKGNQDRDRSELGIGEVQIPSPEECYQGTLENHVKSWFQRAWISSLSSHCSPAESTPKASYGDQKSTPACTAPNSLAHYQEQGYPSPYVSFFSHWGFLSSPM